MSKTISLRLDGNFLDDIDAKCNTQSCTRTDFIKTVIQDALSKKEPKPTVTIIPEKKVVLPSYIPAFNCKNGNCDEVHGNENYSVRPSAFCSNCYQYARQIEPQCAWCLRYNTMKPLEEWQLDKIGIPRPS